MHTPNSNYAAIGDVMLGLCPKWWAIRDPEAYNDCINNKMKKDGTEYLTLVQFRNNTQEWCVVKWGEPCGLSDLSGTKGWLSGMFKLREPTFLEVYELDDVVSTMREKS